MKRISILLSLCFYVCTQIEAQQQFPAPADSVKNITYIDSIFRELPEVMITGERPVAKAEQGKWVYDLPPVVWNEWSLYPVANLAQTCHELRNVPKFISAIRM